MLPIRRILMATDFSASADHAFRIACSIARDYQAEIQVVHVIPPAVIIYGEGVVPVAPAENREAIQAKLATCKAVNVNVAQRILDGDPAAEIVRLAGDMKADIAILGTHGRTGLTRLLLGSVAEQVVRKAPCPVLTMKAPVAAPAEKKPKNREPVNA